MREILYRGKRKDNGEWIYGDLLQCPEINIYTIMPITPISENIQIVPETRGEYTGLTDKNGVKIFEGDIVKYGDEFFKVIFDNCDNTAGYFGIENSNKTLCFSCIMPPRRMEVIGNIFDNPELMGGEKNG